MASFRLPHSALRKGRARERERAREKGAFNPQSAIMKTVAIHYRRPPDREEVFQQKVVAETGEYVVTLLEHAMVKQPLVVEGRNVLEPGAPVVWFTYPDRWYDIGRFHLRDGTFTGLYANVLTPVRMSGETWETTDLFLDVWRGEDGLVAVLDEAEFAEAVERNWIDIATATVAREHAETLALAARQGVWPPQHVWEWTLARARRALARAK
jgi:predicted RNA-binding protein associated with RNAse of E/G family